MSRDFKQEYTSLIKEQTPDLWARIEANLVAKEPASVNAGLQSGLAVVKGNDRAEKATVSKWKANAGRYASYGMAAAAAILICLVVVPFVGMVVSPKGAMESADCAPYMLAMDTAENFVVSEEECVENEAYAVDGDMGADRTTAFYTYDEETGMASGSTKNGSNAEADKYEAVAESAKEGAQVESTKEAEPETDNIQRNENDALTDRTETTTDKAEATTGLGAETAKLQQVEVLEIQKQGDLTIYQAMLGGETISFVLDEKLADKENEITAGMNYQVVLEKAKTGTEYEYIVVEIQ